MPGQWLTDSRRRAAVAIALNLVPFAGIAFLWFIGVVRDRVGGREDRFFATVFLGSGFLFVGMLFVAAAVGGGLIAAAASLQSGPSAAGTLAQGRNVTSILLNVYAMRMAAVFTLTTVNIARRTKIVSRWLATAGLAVALVLLVGVGISAWVELLFPAWILALSIDILRAGPGPARACRKRPRRDNWLVLSQPGRPGPGGPDPFQLPEQLGLGGGEFVVGQRALLMQGVELVQLVEQRRPGGRGRRRGGRRGGRLLLLKVVDALVLLLLLL